MQSQITIDRFLRNRNIYKYKLHAHEKLILFFLASYMGAKSICYPSITSLAKDCSLSIDSIKRAIKLLEKKELLKVTRIAGSNNQYTLNLKIIEQLSANSTECSQLLDADTATPQGLLALPPNADSTPNNNINNFNKSTSINQGEDKISPVNFSKEKLKSDMQEIFQYWQSIMNHPKARLDKKRQQRIKNALELYSKEEIKMAIDGCANNSYNMGKNANGQIYDDIELILRDSTHIERYINTAKVNNHNSINGYNKPECLKGVI